jgi:hypothetical protein
MRKTAVEWLIDMLVKETSGLTWGTLIIMDITKTKIINSMWKMCWAMDVLRETWV